MNMLVTCDLLPPEPGPRFEFWTPKNAKPEKVLCLSAKPWAHYIHWTDGRSQPCTLVMGNDGHVVEACKLCEAKEPNRWKGYLLVYRDCTNRCEFLCLTPVAGHAVLQIVKPKYDLRGLYLEVFRIRGHATGQLVVRELPQYGRREQLAADIDPAPYLDTVFRRRKPLR